MLRWRRVIRDMVVLAVSAGCLLVAFNVFHFFRREAEEEHPDRQSKTRQLADLAFRREHWSQAHEHYAQLTEADPFNGYAWYMAGVCLWNQSYVLQDQLAAELALEAPDAERVETLREQIASIGQRAYDTLNHALEWSRYRNAARLALAAISSAMDRHEEALALLDEAIQDGYFRRGGLQAREFDPLRDDPRFREMLRLENQNTRNIQFGRPRRAPAGNR